MLEDEEYYLPTWEEVINEEKQYKFSSPIRLIELFAGIGSQHEALKRLKQKGILKVPFESWKVVEFDKYAIASYNAIHNTNYPVLDITKIKGQDLEIVDTNKYTYIMFYSFPCQDISVAGKMRGFEKDVGSRSGLLWEVERLLNETKELPQILIMENVKNLLSQKFKKPFNEWLKTLENFGYDNFYKCLNATDYGIPQNRERVFCVSILQSSGGAILVIVSHHQQDLIIVYRISLKKSQ